MNNITTTITYPEFITTASGNIIASFWARDIHITTYEEGNINLTFVMRDEPEDEAEGVLNINTTDKLQHAVKSFPFFDNHFHCFTGGFVGELTTLFVDLDEETDNRSTRYGVVEYAIGEPFESSSANKTYLEFSFNSLEYGDADGTIEVSNTDIPDESYIIHTEMSLEELDKLLGYTPLTARVELIEAGKWAVLEVGRTI
jgi:hypothetical protein